MKAAALLLLQLLALGLAVTAGADEEIPTLARGAVRVRFEGASAFDADDLAEVCAKEIRLFGRSGYDEVYADDAQDRLRRFYLVEGYARIEAAYVSTESEAARGLLRFRIVEGPQILLGRVTFAGNEIVEDEVLESFIRRREGWFGTAVLVESRFESDLGSVELYYAERGYLHLELGTPRLTLEETDKPGIVTGHLEVPLVEGPRTTIGEEDVTIRGDVEDDSVDVRRAIARVFGKARLPDGRRPFDPGLTHRLRAALLDQFGARGHPFVKVEVVRDPLKDPTRAELTVTIEPGSTARVTAIDVEGNRRVPVFVVLRELGFDHDLDVESGGTFTIGDPYDVRRVRNAQRALSRTGYFSTVRIEAVPVEGDPGAVALRVRLREKEHRTVRFRLGWGSYELLRYGFSVEDIAWNGFAETLGLRFSPYALRARLDVEGSTKHAKAGLRIRDPRIFLSRVEAVFDASVEERENVSFTFRRIESRFGFGRPLPELSRHIRTEAAWTFNRTDTFDIFGSLDPEFRDAVNVSSLSIGLIGNWRDDPVWPTRGVHFRVRYEFADQALGGDLDFHRLTASVDNHWPLNREKSWVLALAARGGVILGRGSTDVIPLQERFLSGGSTSVRSYQAQELGPKLNGEPVGGEAYTVWNAEVRFPLLKPLHGAVFVDAGNVYLEASDFALDDLEFGIGAGLRLETPVGPIRLDGAWNPDPGPDDPDWAFHFTVGFAF